MSKFPVIRVLTSCILLVSFANAIGQPVSKYYFIADTLLRENKPAQAYIFNQKIFDELQEPSKAHSIYVNQYSRVCVFLTNTLAEQEKWDSVLYYGLEYMRKMKEFGVPGRDYYTIAGNLITAYHSTGKIEKADTYRKLLYDVDAQDPKALPPSVYRRFNFHFFSLNGLKIRGYENYKQQWGIFMSSKISYVVTNPQDNIQFYLCLYELPKRDSTINFDYVWAKINYQTTDDIDGTFYEYKYKKPLDYRQLDTDVRDFLSGHIKSDSSSIKDTARVQQKMIREAEKMITALVERNWTEFVKYRHPFLVASREGGYAAEAEYYRLENESAGVKFRFSKGELGQPSAIVNVNGEWQCMIPLTLFADMNGKKYMQTTTLIAFSHDNGRTWYFLEPWPYKRKDRREAAIDQTLYISNKFIIKESKWTEIK